MIFALSIIFNYASFVYKSNICAHREVAASSITSAVVPIAIFRSAIFFSEQRGFNLSAQWGRLNYAKSQIANPGTPITYFARCNASSNVTPSMPSTFIVVVSKVNPGLFNTALPIYMASAMVMPS